MLAVDSSTAGGRRRFRRWIYSASFSFAGFLDIAFCSRMLAGLPITDAVLWGILGAVVYAVVYLVISYAAEQLGVDTDRMGDHEVANDFDEGEGEDDQGGWWSDLGWKALATVLVVGSVIVLFVLFAAKSIVVILIFAALAAQPSLGQVLFIMVLSGGLQWLAMYYVAIPMAKRHDISL